MKNKLMFFILLPLYVSVYGQTKSTPEMALLDYQIGKWLAKEIKTDPNGEKYQFGYELQWFNASKTIAKMAITGVYQNGEIKTYWEGFKYWDPAENKILYHGFSVFGPIAEGYIEQKSDTVIITSYSGMDPKGNPVQLIDYATKKDDTHYTSETHIKREGEDYAKMNTDNWVKVSEQKFNNQLI